MSITCDCCGREMNDRFEIEGMQGHGGNCGVCGENLCAECAGEWGEDGECHLCSLTLDELEYSLPLTIEREEKKEMPCGDCKRNCKEIVRYEQRIYRSDDYSSGEKKRSYEILYVRQYAHGKYLFRTERYRTLRNAFIEAYRTLEKMGFKDK